MESIDDGIVLNLVPFEFKPTATKKKQHPNLDKCLERKQVRSNSHSRNPNSKKHKYVDPKDFTPISTLFNKNPEIPEVISSNIVARSQDVVFSSENVDDLHIVERLRSNLKDQFKFITLTKVQQLSIPSLLQGKDALIKSPTGSGKTMCYAIPVLDKLSKMVPSINRSDGTYCIILVPTRELALQTFNILQDLCKSCIAIVPGMLIGGEKCKSEKARLRKGVNIIVATPGRLNYHLKETSCLDVSKVCFLVLDEADRLLDMGFENTVKEILVELDQKSNISRQSILLSATLDVNVECLASICLHKPIFIDATTDSMLSDELKPSGELVVPGSLSQYYVIVPAKLRLVSLLSFVAAKAFINKEKGKVIVFCSNKNSVSLLMDVFKSTVAKFLCLSQAFVKKLYMLHGNIGQQERFKTFEKFKISEFGVLICTDVAARGLDIKSVEWIIQYSCPTLVEDYLHRVGRTARIGKKGKSLLFILPSEVEYLKLLGKSSIVLQELKVFDILKSVFRDNHDKGSQKKVELKATELQKNIEESVLENKDLHNKAVLAYKSYVQSYSTYPASQKHIFHVKLLHFGHIAKSFGLREAPKKFVASVPTTVGLKRKVEGKKKENAKRIKMRSDINKTDNEIVSGPRPRKERIGTMNSKGRDRKLKKKKQLRI